MIVVDPNDPSPIGDDVRLTGVNNHGQVVGWFYVDGGNPRNRGFIWSEDSGYQLIGSPNTPPLNVYPEGIDDMGRIAVTANREFAQYMFQVARASTYDTVTGIWAEHHPWTGCSSQMQAMSEGGWFCGELADLDQNGNCGSLFFEAEGFVGNIDGVSRIGTFSQWQNFAHDVNSNGDVCGEGYLADGVNVRGFIKEQGSEITVLPGLGGSYAFAYGINNLNEVVGWGYSAGDNFNFAAKWTDDSGDWEVKNLDPGTLFSVARDINDFGHIVGWYYDEDFSDRRAVLWVNDEPFVLDTLITNPIPDVIVWDAFQISNTNWIIGEGRRNGERVGIILKPVDQDSDGDGLLDSWEKNGIDANRDGTIDLMLPEGVDPLRKDILVEIDVMQGAPFYQEGLDDVVQSFANAPVMNPDGSMGITAHFVISDTDLPFAESWDGAFDDFNIITPAFVGDADERMDPNWDNILEARQKSFRYCAVINKPGDALGYAEQPGNQFMVGVAGQSNNRRTFASTFMHELGHNLGLGHGGQDDVNFKPNYVSCMNYNFDQLTLCNGDPLPLDFAREANSDLNELHLNETVGYYFSDIYSEVLTFYGYEDSMGNRAINWVQLDVENFDWNVDGMQDADVEVDLNWMPMGYPGGASSPSSGQLLESLDDWSRIAIPLGQTGPYSMAQALQTGVIEQTDAERAWLEANLPDPPINMGCPADLTGDGALDFFDVSAFLTAYTALDPVADFNGDGSFDFFDVSAFLTAYNAGCP